MVHMGKDLGLGISLIASVHPGDIAPKHRIAVLGCGMNRKGPRTAARHSPPQGKEAAGKLDGKSLRGFDPAHRTTGNGGKTGTGEVVLPTEEHTKDSLWSPS